MKRVVNRLKKVNGQISGIIKLIEKEEDCDKVIIQFQAAKAALESAFSESLSENLEKCLKSKDKKNVKKILSLISKK